MTLDQGHSDVARLWQQLRRFRMRPALWLDLARGYAGRGLLWQAGYAARQVYRLDASLLLQLQALQLGPWQDTHAGDALLGGLALADAGALTQRFAQAVAQCPGDWLTWLYLARLREMPGGEAQAGPHAIADADPQADPHATPHASALAQAQRLEPMAGESLHWLGVWRLQAGDGQAAVTAFSGLLDIRPLRFGSMMFLGEALLRVGNVAAAHKAFARASHSHNPDFLQTLAARVLAHNYWQEAIDILHKALALRPNSVPILLALAKIQSEVYALADCRESLRRLHVLAPDHLEARLLGAGLQGRMGDANGHLATLQAALAAGADPLSRIASSVAMTALYHDAMPSAELADLHRSLCAPIEAAMAPHTGFSRARARSRTKRLRIGYVTGDLHRQHPVNIFMLPVLLRHDRARFEIHVYYTGTMHDEYTRQAQACADHWREAAALDDAALQRAIVADGIDILIDLAGHTASHRLGVFALRAAPVQATFLGYPHSTGLSRMDWLIGDATVSPAEHAHLFSEGIAQMPGSVFCWAPVDDYALPAPRAADAPLVLGSFNNALKLSPTTIALWSRVLRALPQSQLLLKAPSLRAAAVQARYVALFAEQGIASERLLLRGPSGLAEMMQAYGDMDIALDPTPYNGGTTTLQALWMGVPVVALTGHNFVGRMGASFLRTLGQPTWTAPNHDAYVAAATALAQGVSDLRQGRAVLRAQMAASPLCDIDNYVLDFETLLERMWAQHGAGGTARLLPASPA